MQSPIQIDLHPKKIMHDAMIQTKRLNNGSVLSGTQSVNILSSIYLASVCLIYYIDFGTNALPSIFRNWQSA